MQFYKFFSAIIISFFIALGFTACKQDKQQNKHNTPKQTLKLKSIDDVDFAHQASDIKPDANVKYGKLENGVRYAVMKNNTPTKTAALKVYIGTGSFNEKDDERGLAHFLEHMAFNGSKNIPEGEMIKRLERLGLSFGADTNAYTSFEETVYMLNLPNVEDEMLDETMMIMRETVSNLSLAQDAIDRERGVVQSEKRNMDAPSVRASLESLKFFTKGARIYDRIPIGTDETLAKINSEQMRNYYNSYYRPENTFIVFVGDVEPDKAIAKIKQYFEDWQAVGEAGEIKDTGKVEPRPMDVGYFSHPDVQTSIQIATVKPYTYYPDTIANRKLGFIENLGNRIVNRRLSALAQKPDAVFISAGIDVSSPFETMDQASISINAKPENWKKAMAVVEHEVRKAHEFGFTEAELAEQIANSRKSMQVAVQTADTRRTSSLASSILGAFSGESVFSHPRDSLERFEKYADTITTDMVWAEYKKQWSGLDNPLIFLTTSQELKDPKAEIIEAWKSIRAEPVKANAKKKAGKFAYTDFGKLGKIVSEKYIKEADAYTFKFDNNVTLNFKKTDFEKNAIRINVRIGDGALSMPSKQSALLPLTSTVMNAGGLEAHSADEVRTLLAGKAVNAGFGIGTQYFTLSGSTVPDDLHDEFNYLMARLIAPGYRPEAKSRFNKSIENWYKTLDSTPDGVAARDVPKLIHSGDERYGIPSLETLLAPKTEDVKAWLEPFLQHGQIDITVIGDIDKDEIIKQVARTFGTLPKRNDKLGQYPDMTKLTFPSGTKTPKIIKHAGDANRGLLQVYWPAPDGRDIMINRRLSVLRSILNNRLTDIIREDEAAAYTPSAGRSGSRFFPNYGYMMISLGLKPEKINDMSKKIAEIAEDMRTGNISDDEFKRAMKPILENLDTSLESNSYWAGVIANVQNDSWGLDAFKTREKAFQSMTLDEIKPLAAQIFQKDKAYEIHIIPEKK